MVLVTILLVKESFLLLDVRGEEFIILCSGFLLLLEGFNLVFLLEFFPSNSLLSDKSLYLG